MKPTTRPNILIIMADQLRSDSLGYAGKYPVSTPNIDRIASGGMVFNHAYTTIPICCPARQSFLTGDSAEHIGALWNYDITLPVPSLTPGTPTWTQSVSVLGYNSAYIGKWHCSPDFTPVHFGFDSYYGEMDYEKELEQAGITEGNQPAHGWEGYCSTIPLSRSRTHVLADKAISRIEEFSSEESPWLLCLEFPEPHPPCNPSEPFYSMYDPKEITPWDGFPDTMEGKPSMQVKQQKNWGIDHYTWEEFAPTAAAYYGIISQMDDAIGKVMHSLEQSGQADGTLIVFTADHGDMCGSHGMVDKHYIMYDDVVHVPLVMSCPDLIPAGSHCDEFVSHTLDIPATLLDLIEVEPNPNMQGISFAGWFKDAEGKKPIRDCVTATYHGSQFGLYCQRMIRTKEYKYVWNPTDTDELYSLTEDPGELHNLIDESDYGEVLHGLRQRLHELLLKQGDDLLRKPWLSPQLTGEPLDITIEPTV